ncbi:MAG: aspartate kinase [Candidatus Bathyarchaeia archaeon]
MGLAKGRVVVKFGGADLSTGEKIRKAAEMAVKSVYKEIVVVVSAMGETTNNLVKVLSSIEGVSDREYADVVSMGERTSARIFCSALRAQGANAIYVDPDMDEWPIITDSSYRDAKPDMKETCARVKRHLEPMLGENIPVVCGFLGRDRSGNITTLGRGGSDTTALILANCLNAQEVVLVKETQGVMSADPNVVPDAKPLRNLDIHEMFALAHGGAKIIKAEALKYKLPNQRLRVVSFSSGLGSDGTEISGEFNFNSFEIKERRGLLAASLVCEINSRSVGFIFSALGDRPIYGISSGAGSITVFTSSEDAAELLNDLHSSGVFKAVSCRNNVSMIELMHPIFIDSPGWVAKVTGALASKEINIIEITTSKASINIFVDESRLDEAIKAVRDSLET